MIEEDDSFECHQCFRWIQNTGDWYCEECDAPTCENCGTLDHVDGFLCPDCFSTKPKSDDFQ